MCQNSHCREILNALRQELLSKIETCFISNFLLKVQVLYLTIFKWKNLSLPLKVETDQLIIYLVYRSVFLSKFVAFHPRTVKRIVTVLMSSLLFRCFSLFLSHLRTLAQEKRSENCLRFGTGGPSLCLYPLLSRDEYIFPCANNDRSSEKKDSGEAFCSRYQRALLRLRMNLIARLC